MARISRGWASMNASILRSCDRQKLTVGITAYFLHGLKAGTAVKTDKRGVTMAKYIPPEQMAAQQIQAELDREFQRWNDIACSGCQDPTWPDGVNMNLVRNHIIYWYKLLDEKQSADTQTSLFDMPTREVMRRPVPPKAPDQYMVAGCKYSDRLNGRCGQPLVWGVKGEYRA